MNVRVAIVAVALVSALAWTQPIASNGQTATTLVIDGTQANLTREPVRVGNSFFVPVRETFAALGASVHAHADEITATAPAYAVMLHVGSATATLDGHDQTLSTPPVLIDGTVFAPLRFVAIAVKAKVRYDAVGRTIYLDRANAATETPTPLAAQTVLPAPIVTPEPTPTPTTTPTPISLPTPSIVLRLVREEPARETTVDRSRPEISASFGEVVAGASVRVLLDGREITADATITNRYFIYEPTEDLPIGTHVVLVAGRTPLHEAFADRWSFDSAPPKGHNYLSGVEPPSGISATSPLVISGITRPHARIGMVATSSETAAHFSELSGGSFTDHTVADEHGNFEISLDLVDRGSGFLDVRLDSTAPDGAVAVKTLRLRL